MPWPKNTQPNILMLKKPKIIHANLVVAMLQKDLHPDERPAEVGDTA
jgi:hypothetical protein